MHGIVLVDGVGQELFSGASMLARRVLTLVIDDEDDDEPCPETMRSGRLTCEPQERPIEVAVAW
jgi:hypothetical protein